MVNIQREWPQINLLAFRRILYFSAVYSRSIEVVVFILLLQRSELDASVLGVYAVLFLGRFSC